MDYVVAAARNMRLKRIFGTILLNNVKMIKLCEKKGFKIETLDEETIEACLAIL
jgi:RimJ/RimL family protein N-acetyltransferase